MDRGTAALKPRLVYRWPVRDADVCDVILKARGGGGRRGGHLASHQKSPVTMATACEERQRGPSLPGAPLFSPEGFHLAAAGILNVPLLAPGKATSCRILLAVFAQAGDSLTSAVLRLPEGDLVESCIS